MGRKPVEGVARMRVVTVRLSDEEHDQLSSLADSLGVPMSRVAMRLIVEGMTARLQRAERKTARASKAKAAKKKTARASKARAAKKRGT